MVSSILALSFFHIRCEGREGNADASGTGGGPPRESSLSDVDRRFLGVMGPGFGQTDSTVRINPFPDRDTHSLSASANEASTSADTEVVVAAEDVREDDNGDNEEQGVEIVLEPIPVNEIPPAPQRSRRKRLRSRPLAPLDEARRILSQVEMQRAEADAATARALNLIGQSLAQLADVAQRFLEHVTNQ